MSNSNEQFGVVQSVINDSSLRIYSVYKLKFENGSGKPKWVPKMVGSDRLGLTVVAGKEFMPFGIILSINRIVNGYSLVMEDGGVFLVKREGTYTTHKLTKEKL